MGYRRLFLFMLVLSTLLWVSTSQGKAWKYMDHTAITWRAYGQEAFTVAQQRGQPVFVFIYADWCEWCKKYEQGTLETPRIRKRLQQDFIAVAIDYDRQPALAKRLGAKLVPTSLLLAPDGRKLLRFFGVIGPADLNRSMDNTVAGWRRGELPEEDFGDESTCCPLTDVVPGDTTRP